MAPAPKTAPSPKSSESPPPPPPKKSPPPPPKSPPPSPPPPPPPPPKKSPPPPKKSPPPPKSPPPTKSEFDPHAHKSHELDNKLSQTGNSNSNASNKSIITSIALFLVILVFICFVTICITCIKRRKKKRRLKSASYYNKPPPGGEYYKHEHVIQFTIPEMMGTPVGVSGKYGPQQHSKTSDTPKMNLAFSMTHFSYNELSSATDGFSQSNMLGQGGFGYVFKGVLSNGHEVAVKRLKSGSSQGEREFQAEVEIISRVHHRHLVSLVGYCIADAQRLLVYEFVPNKTLDFHLHGNGCPVMKWETRVRIALGSAKGLAYLHEDCDQRIIHRDIKSSNILLDHNFEAKVADFGLAKLASCEDTHISTRVMGTFGYLAPEYASSGKLTEKSDVFSFGVMLLELLTGKKPNDPTYNRMDDSLIEWAGPLLAKALEDQDYDELVDPRLEGNYEPNKAARMVSCVAASIRHSAKLRPKMSQIVRALESEGSLDSLNDTLNPHPVDPTLSE